MCRIPQTELSQIQPPSLKRRFTRALHRLCLQTLCNGQSLSGVLQYEEEMGFRDPALYGNSTVDGYVNLRSCLGLLRLLCLGYADGLKGMV